MHLRLVKLFYDLAYAEARQRAGMALSAADQQRLAGLRELFGADPGWRRRAHRRMPVELTGTLRISGHEAPVAVLDMSAGGAAVLAERVLAPGTKLQLKLTACGQTLYVFPCQVRRVEASIFGCRMALAFDGIPLELRRLQSRPAQLPQLFSAAS